MDDFDVVVKDATPRLKAKKRQQVPVEDPNVKPAHKHLTTANHPRDVKYSSGCKACQWEDRERWESKTPLITPEEVQNTIFLVPDFHPDVLLCTQYVQNKYPDATFIGSTLNYELIAGYEGMKVVVVCRRPKHGQRFAPNWRRELGADNRWEDREVPLSELAEEVKESAPIDIAECIDVSAPSLMAKTQINPLELVNRIAEVAPLYQCFWMERDQILRLTFR